MIPTKLELFSLLADSIYQIENGIVYATKNSSSISNKIARAGIQCTHEEADTRVFVHLTNAIDKMSWDREKQKPFVFPRL